MSYDIYLNDPITGRPILLNEPHHARGGTYAVGGTRTAWLNVTYNYSQHFTAIGDAGIRSIYGKTGTDSIPMLNAAIEKLGDDVDENYWKATEGNAKRALLQLRQLAEMHPNGVWGGD